MADDEKLPSLLTRLTEMEARLTARIAGVETEVRKTRGVVEAWDTVKSGSKFLKWTASVVVALVVLWNAVRIGILDQFRH